MRFQKCETFLNEQGVKWSYVEDVPLDEIDRAKSLANQARLTTPIDEELIAEYVDREKHDGAKSQSPALVGYRNKGKGRVIICDGIQRYEAKSRAGRKTTDFYLIDCDDPKVIQRITYTINNYLHGKRNPGEEMLMHAVDYHRAWKDPVVQVAKEFGIRKSGTLQAAVNLREAKDLLTTHSVPKRDLIPDSVVLAMIPLSNLGEDIFVRIGTVVASAGLTQDDVRELSREVKRASTSEDKIKAIDRFVQSEKISARRAETKGGQIRVRPDGPREKHKKLTKEMRNHLEDHSPTVLTPRSHEYREFRSMAAEIVYYLTRMYGLGPVSNEVMKEVG